MLVVVTIVAIVALVLMYQKTFGEEDDDGQRQGVAGVRADC